MLERPRLVLERLLQIEAFDWELRLLKVGNLKKMENIHIEHILAYSPNILEQCDQSTTSCWQMDNIWPLVIILEKAVQKNFTKCSVIGWILNADRCMGAWSLACFGMNQVFDHRRAFGDGVLYPTHLYMQIL
jgi:hypothetical protein